VSSASTVCPTSSPWRARALERIAALDRMVAEGRGNVLVEGGGCTEPGGGIVSVQRTARQMAQDIRAQLGLVEDVEARGTLGDSQGPPSPRSESGLATFGRIVGALALAGGIAGMIWLASRDAPQPEPLVHRWGRKKNPARRRARDRHAHA